MNSAMKSKTKSKSQSRFQIAIDDRPASRKKSSSPRYLPQVQTPYYQQPQQMPMQMQMQQPQQMPMQIQMQQQQPPPQPQLPMSMRQQQQPMPMLQQQQPLMPMPQQQQAPIRIQTPVPVFEAPQMEIKSGGGNQYLLMTFTSPYQKIMCDPGTLMYMKGPVDRGVVKLNTSIGNAIKRIFSGQDMFINEYVGLPECSPTNRGVVALNFDIPSNIVQIELNDGEELRISRGSFLACTHNIELMTTTMWKGMLEVGQEEGFILPLLKCRGNGGKVWLSSYGVYEKHILKPGESIIVNNGLFLACNNNIKPEIVKFNKTITDTLLSQEGYGMLFTSGTIYTQSKNMNNFVNYIQNRIQTGGSLKPKPQKKAK
jgi:uncharacterized protein (AIM24 family)